MKNRIVVGGLVPVLASAGVPPVRGQSGPLQIRVEVKTDKEYKYKSEKLSLKRCTRQLDVIVKNLGAQRLNQAVVKYYLFARDVDLGPSQPLGSGGAQTVARPQAALRPGGR